MYIDNDNVADFLARYEDACLEAGIEPLSIADLAVLVGALLSREDAATTLH